MATECGPLGSTCELTSFVLSLENGPSLENGEALPLFNGLKGFLSLPGIEQPLPFGNKCVVNAHRSELAFALPAEPPATHIDRRALGRRSLPKRETSGKSSCSSFADK